MKAILHQQIVKGNSTIAAMSCLRIKLLSKCQWNCKFCHQEGNTAGEMMAMDGKYKNAIKQFVELLGITEVHFTGGEPTLHRDLCGFVALGKSSGLVTKATTNGQASPAVYSNALEAGLSEVNMSVHTLDGAMLSQFQAAPRDAGWGTACINRQIGNLMFLKNRKAKVKVNTVVSTTCDEAIRIGHFCKEHGIPWRPMNDLNNGEIAYTALRDLIQVLGATVGKATLFQNSSACSLAAAWGKSYEIKIKLIREFKLKSLCNGCPLAAVGKCAEYIYGPRLESHDGKLYVRMCLHREGAPYSMPVENFFKSDVFKEYKKLSTIVGEPINHKFCGNSEAGLL